MGCILYMDSWLHTAAAVREAKPVAAPQAKQLTMAKYAHLELSQYFVPFVVGTF